MPIVERFNTLTCGQMTFTGNTLGLSQETNTNDAGTAGSIGAFTTIDTSMQVDAFPQGTTYDYTENSSSAILTIPSGSTVLYAELIWGGNYLTIDEDISGDINNQVLFTDADGNTTAISPDPATANEHTFAFQSGQIGFYSRSADVTSIVQAAGAGTYTTGSVPGLLDPQIASTANTNHAGWTLAVVYENTSLPNRSMYLYVGSEGIVSSAIGTPFIDIPITGFSTPPSGPVDIHLLISAQEGDANISGDQALFGPDALSLVPLSGPNNPVTNFFGSQINDDSGNLDTSGTFGNRNQDPFTSTNIVAGRQGWDITNVDASGILGNNETSAVFRYSSVGDAYMPNALGVQINEGDPEITVEKSVNKTIAQSGDVLTYEITVRNDGVVEATDVVLTDIIPSGASFIFGTVKIDGVVDEDADPEDGISLPDIESEEEVSIQFKVRVHRCDCFIMNRAQVMFSCGKTESSNPATTTICQSCTCKGSCCCH